MARFPVGLGGGGAMVCPAISPHDPELMFVACDMGGLYRWEKQAARWDMIEGTEMRGSVFCPVSFHPSDDQIVYAYSRFRGLRWSGDGGKSWPETQTLVADPNGNLLVTAFAIDPDDPDIMFYGTEATGIFRSGDGGTSWTNVASDVNGLFVVRFFIDPNSSRGAQRRCFAATRAAGVLQSNDGGTTWQPANGSGQGELPGKNAIRSFAGGANTQTGATVLYVTVPGTQNGTKLEGGVYRSEDAGATWQPAMGPAINQDIGKKDQFAACDLPQYQWVDVASNNPDVVYVTLCGTASKPTPYTPGGAKQPSFHSGVYKSLDQGKTWEHVFYYVQSNFDPAILANANVWSGWLEWDRHWDFGGPAMVVDLNLEYRGGLVVGPKDANVALFTNKAVIYATDDGGGKWMQRYSMLDPQVTPPTSAGESLRDKAWQSIGLEVTTSWYYHVDPNPNEGQRHYICYSDVGFARSETGGKSWFHSPTGSPWDGNFYQLAFDLAIPGRIWAAASNQHDIPYDDWLWVRNSGGVVRSDDFGKTWQDASGNLLTLFPQGTMSVPPVVSVVLDTQRQPGTKRLWISVFGAGVFSSDDEGQTWTPRSAQFGAGTNVYRLFQHPVDGTLYCSITGKRDPTAAGRPFVQETGLWKLPPSTAAAPNPQWQKLTPAPGGSPDLWWITDYAVHPTDSNVILLCTAHVRKGLAGGINRPGAVYRTTNANAAQPTWTSVLSHEPLPNQPAPPDRILPWKEWDFVHAFAPIFDPANPDTVYVTTRTHGIWISDTAGDPAVPQPTWKPYNAIPFVSVHRLFFRPWTAITPAPAGGVTEQRDIYVTTFGGGVWKVTEQR